MTNEEIKDKYYQVENLLGETLDKAQNIKLAGIEENKELTAINTMLQSLNEDFKQEIEKLESSSEWDKFCIAFFGETNAGKSTIIESLRIMHNEEQRRERIVEKEQGYETALVSYCDEFKELIRTLEELNNELRNMEEDKPFRKILKSLGLIAFGIVIGCIAMYLGLS